VFTYACQATGSNACTIGGQRCVAKMLKRRAHCAQRTPARGCRASRSGCNVSFVVPLLMHVWCPAIMAKRQGESQVTTRAQAIQEPTAAEMWWTGHPHLWMEVSTAEEFWEAVNDESVDVVLVGAPAL
jgi:hypothetical protein